MADQPTTTKALESVALPGDLPFDELLATLREGYSHGINDILDACLANLILPQHQEAVCVDAAQFLTFMLAIKIVTNNLQPMEGKHLMQAYRHLNKAIEKEVPGMLIAFAREVPANQVQPAVEVDEELDAMLDTIAIVEPANEDGEP